MAGLTIDRQRRDVFPQHFEIGGNQEEKLGAAGNKEAGGQVVGNQVSIKERGTIWRPPSHHRQQCVSEPQNGHLPAIRGGIAHCPPQHV